MLAHMLGYFFAYTIALLLKEYVYRDYFLMLLMIPAGLTLILSLIHKTRTALQVIGQKPLARSYDKLPRKELGNRAPFVSIHVPCRNEEPDHVIACVQSLIDQDYPNFEVIVIDNNSTDEKYWRPLEAFCLQHPERVKFLHVEKLAGFKAGALAYAMNHIHPDTAVVGLIDADYIVDKNWLKDCVPYFVGKVGAVQAPQDYVPEFDSLFMRCIYDEYVGFFRIGMVQRNESNSIIQHGTMLLLDKDALVTAGGWQTDTIVEDTDLGLRLLIGGYECVYINKVYGHGRLPTRFAEYRKQRFRWSYGAMRTIIKYAGYLLWFRKGLSLKQRVHFILGWVPWLGNAFHPLFMLGAILLSYFYILGPDYVVTAAIFMPILVYVLLDTWFSGFLYSARLGLPLSRILLSFIAGASLVWTIGRGILTGIFYRNYPFKVTKKGKTQITKNLSDNFPLIVSVIVLLMDLVIWMRYPQPIPSDVKWWMLLLIVLAFPGICCQLMNRFENIVPKAAKTRA
jgi:cellulose synthase/poly-beta-1,6-N-acetylglucosamine synthase-like glycosyltransferase